MKKGYIGPVPVYAILPAVVTVALGASLYFLSRPFTNGLVHYNISTPIDDKIPFVPQFVYIYALALVQWLSVLVIAAREERKIFYKYMSAEFMGRFIALVFFIVFPTMMIRADLSGMESGGLTAWMMKGLYQIDAPNNLFPSLHCLDSWVCYRAARECKKMPGWYAPSMLVFSLLVFASTVLVKQHVFVDIIGGVIIGELVVQLSGRFETGKVYRIFETGYRAPRRIGWSANITSKAGHTKVSGND